MFSVILQIQSGMKMIVFAILMMLVNSASSNLHIFYYWRPVATTEVCQVTIDQDYNIGMTSMHFEFVLCLSSFAIMLPFILLHLFQ